MNVLDRINKGLFYLDGGTGSVLQELGLKPGELPELWNINRPDDIVELGRRYYEAGSNAICTNTFGANGLKYDGKEGRPTVEEVILAATKCARKASEVAQGPYVQEDRYVALDIGPIGKILEPIGDLKFEQAVELFAEQVRAGVKAGVDYIYIETMNDAYETKAAVLAAKENSNLPVFASNAYDESGKLMTGASPEAMVATLEGLRVDALGANCSLGPEQLMPLVPRLVGASSLPVMIKPNAGLPRSENGKTVYDVTPEQFASYMKEIVEHGARILGGCCGTTPDFIRAVVDATRDMQPKPVTEKKLSVVSSYAQCVSFDGRPVLIGERINPTGKKKFKEALRNHDIGYILNEGINQADAGAHVLDVNVGLPEIDEPALLKECIQELQAVTALPLQIDTTDVDAMEQAMRIYNGKPMINSVNGKLESMEAVFPLVKKYGGYVVCLTLDEDGIPETAEKRYEIAEKITNKASEYGIKPCDLIFDPLAMTISSDNRAALATLDAIRMIKEGLGGKTSLGISNISFGLPSREYVTASFFIMALNQGLNAAIMNPFAFEMQKAYHTYLALNAMDESCMEYIEFASKAAEEAAKQAELAASRLMSGAAGGTANGASGTAAGGTANGASGTGAGGTANGASGTAAGGSSDKGSSRLNTAIVKGLKEEAGRETALLVAGGVDGLEIINDHIIPALDVVGKGFEAKTMYLPQLLMSAEAAKAAFVEVKKSMGEGNGNGPGVIVATVKGDIHDIGKNIVKVLLENYSFNVIDLGKDVDPEIIAKTAIEKDIKLVGLSALMTTTVPAMEETIKLLRVEKPDCKVVVGGAVLTQEYADMIGADKYAGNAMETVRYAEEILLGKHGN